jgi:hypothetical protein
MKPSFMGIKAASLRERSERCREMAAKVQHPKARADLEEAAEGWLQLALRQELLDGAATRASPG